MRALDFNPGLMAPKFKAFFHTNQFRIYHFTRGMHWSTIEDIGKMVSPPLDHWSALQIHHYPTSSSDGGVPRGPITDFEEYNLDSSTLGHALSKTYSIQSKPSEGYVPKKEKGFGVDIHC